MSSLKDTTAKRASRKQRVRAKVSGTKSRPRLAVHISNKHVIAQIINDEESKTVAYATTASRAENSGSMTEKAALIGMEIAKKAVAKKIKAVVFDRGSRLYHGRIKALADAARKGGLEF